MNFWERGGNYNSQNNGGYYNNSQGNGYNQYDNGCQNGFQGAGNQNASNNQYDSRRSSGADNRQSTGCSEQDVRQKFEQYSNKSEDQLMNELTSMVARMKSEGSFDANAIENLYNTASPFLNEMQRQRMRSIIDMLKG